MAKVTIYLKDSLAEAAKDLDLPLSAVCQPAVEAAVASRLPLNSFTPQARRVLQRAAREAELLGDRHVGTEHLLLAIAGDEVGTASQVLEELDVRGAIFERTRALVRAAIPSNRVVDRSGRVIGFLEPSGKGQVRIVDERGKPIALSSETAEV